MDTVVEQHTQLADILGDARRTEVTPAQDALALEMTDGTLAVVVAKPLLRGWSHAVAAAGALALTAIFCWRERDASRLLPLLLYGVSLTELYTVSAVYHLGTWRAARYRLLRALDHSSIFIAIASAYTPFCVSILHGFLRIGMLCGIWLLALVGVVLKFRAPYMPRKLSTTLYLGMGWAAVCGLPTLWVALPIAAAIPLLLAGVCYTAGALVFRWQRPDPLPHIFGYHEVFHLLVIGGSACIVVVLWIWVIPLL